MPQDSVTDFSEVDAAAAAARAKAKRKDDRKKEREAERKEQAKIANHSCRNCDSHSWRIVRVRKRKNTDDTIRTVVCRGCGLETKFIEDKKGQITLAPEDDQVPLPEAAPEGQNVRKIVQEEFAKVKTELLEGVAELLNGKKKK